MENLQYTGAERTTIKAVINGVPVFIPVSAGNRHYDQIVADDLEIAEPDAD